MVYREESPSVQLPDSHGELNANRILVAGRPRRLRKRRGNDRRCDAAVHGPSRLHQSHLLPASARLTVFFYNPQALISMHIGNLEVPVVLYAWLV